MDIEGLVEWSAVGFGLAYLILAMREHIACWTMALISTSLFLWLFWQAKLMMESALQVYYIAMAVYGWWQWRGGKSGTEKSIQTLNIRQHLLICASVALLTLGSGFWLSAQTEASQPFLDSFTTWGSIITTVLVAHKVLENWLYWIVIDIASMILYANSGLWVTVTLFALYVVLAILGYAQWRKHLLPNHYHSASNDA
jgi:nicotinamide mononucleotide transporter